MLYIKYGPLRNFTTFAAAQRKKYFMGNDLRAGGISRVLLQAYPMKTKGEAHAALSLMCQHEGIPPLMIMVGSKEQTLGKFHQKHEDADCEKNSTETYSPWQNATERETKDLKKGAGRKLLLTNKPRRLWDNCLGYEPYVRSHTAHDMFKLDGEVPETTMSGKTDDINQFCELGWYEWVKFCSTTISFPE